jgi:hypothetical protein
MNLVTVHCVNEEAKAQKCQGACSWSNHWNLVELRANLCISHCNMMPQSELGEDVIFLVKCMLEKAGCL